MSPRISTPAIWAAAAVVAIIAGTMAVVAVATDSPDRRSQEDIARELAQARTQTPEPTQSPTDSASPAGDEVTLSTTGAVIQASCDGDVVYLNSWSPKQGYRVDKVERGPAEEASLWLESDRFDDVRIKVRCENGAPVAETDVEDDDNDDDDNDHGED